jgi:hypothetical protein
MLQHAINARLARSLEAKACAERAQLQQYINARLKVKANAERNQLQQRINARLKANLQCKAIVSFQRVQLQPQVWQYACRTPVAAAIPVAVRVESQQHQQQQQWQQQQQYRQQQSELNVLATCSAGFGSAVAIRCFHCKQTGHKVKQCPLQMQAAVNKPRKKKKKMMIKKKKVPCVQGKYRKRRRKGRRASQCKHGSGSGMRTTLGDFARPAYSGDL